jgi:GNAT superfamily N-acetyltransferase
MHHQLSVTLESESDAAEATSVGQSLARFNTTSVGPDHCVPLNVFARSHEGEIFPALLGETDGNWLHVRILLVHAAHRNMGLGRRLVQEAEKEAQRRGCYSANLDAHDFQAEDFYLKNGYEVFGVLEDLPPDTGEYTSGRTVQRLCEIVEW